MAENQMKFEISSISEELLRSTVTDLSRVRQWIEGFEAAGGKGPPHADSLRWAQIILGSAKRPPSKNNKKQA